MLLNQYRQFEEALAIIAREVIEFQDWVMGIDRSAVWPALVISVHQNWKLMLNVQACQTTIITKKKCSNKASKTF